MTQANISGIERHIVVDVQGLPHAVAVATAEATDRKGTLQPIARCKPALRKFNVNNSLGRPFALAVDEY